jgi:hypothetical protein
MIKLWFFLLLSCATRTVPEKVDERAASSPAAKEAVAAPVTRSLAEEPPFDGAVTSTVHRHHGGHHAH